jgi:hypothetical protein
LFFFCGLKNIIGLVGFLLRFDVFYEIGGTRIYIEEQGRKW